MNNEVKNEEAKIDEAELKATIETAKEISRQLKKKLKKYTKSQLIMLVIKYASDVQDMQAVARQLYEENLSLKGAVDENND